MRIKGLIIVSLFAGAIYAVGQVNQPALQIDLRSHGWKADRIVLDGSWLPYTIDFTDDDTLWVAFPTETSKPLQSRDVPSEYVGKVLHIAPSGEVVGECNIAALQWNFLSLYAHRADGFTLDTANKIVSYDAHCKLQSIYPTDDRTGISPSPNRALIYTRTLDNHIHVLNGDGLAVIRELDLPESVHRKKALFGDRLVVYPVTIPTRSCFQSQFSRVEIANGQTTPWVNIDCARFNLLGGTITSSIQTVAGMVLYRSSEARMVLALSIIRRMTLTST